MTNPEEQEDGLPSCFVELLKEEYRRLRNKHMRYIFRYLLSKYPKDLLRSWWRVDGCMPWAATQFAFRAYQRGAKPSDFSLYKGPPHKTQLKVIAGGKAA
ncbi:hypothetical protein UP10_14480 [Bradyrhizobium sp. LTSPM299]|uniref:hypothetical protein n=1 Tax=Bradyrhizobium sp. LTSPM299 TaxID=1619233 RepID=UPI0005C9D650|nr:hypothetical protein [Bradyrhizobium sp. LTSPM299]KJC59899.1 hypothetical protein UP10_14480 [Bradyrhizobium sp. LTSPM299]